MLEMNTLKKQNGACGNNFIKTSEYWDINELIYGVECKLNSIKYPIEAVVIVYLIAGCDFTEKWYAKTHETFLKRYINHCTYVGDLSNDDQMSVNGNAYRKLIHATWMTPKSDPDNITFQQLRTDSQTKKDVR